MLLVPRHLWTLSHSENNLLTACHYFLLMTLCLTSLSETDILLVNSHHRRMSERRACLRVPPFPRQSSSLEILASGTADISVICRSWRGANLPLSSREASLSLLFPGSVWPAVSPVLRRSLVDFASCEGVESQPEGWWLTAIRTKKKKKQVQIMLKH